MPRSETHDAKPLPDWLPYGIVAALIYAVMSSGALEMELATDIPTELVSVIVCCAVLFVTAGVAVADRLANRIRED